MSSTTTPRLPSELNDAIIDQLQPDLKVLGACGLVCSEWLKRSRHHLFSTVQLWPWRVRSFVNLISSPTSTIPLHVHRVDLDESRVRKDAPRTEFLDVLSLIDLPGLQAIRICNVDWTMFSPPEQTEVRQKLAKFQRLKHLEFDNVTFHDLREIVNIANLFPFLNNLSTNVRFMKYKEHAIASATTLRLPQSLKRVEMGSDDAIPVVTNCISAAKDDLHLERLSIRSIRMDHLPHIRHAIKRVGSELQSLALGLDDLHWEEDVSEDELLAALKLAKLSRLRLLSIQGLHLTPEILENTLPRLLSRLESPFLHTIDIGFTSDATGLEQLNWDRLQRVLMELHFFGVRNINLRIHLPSGGLGRGDHDGVAERTFRRALHELDARGVLQVLVLRRPAGACQEVLDADAQRSSV